MSFKRKFWNQHILFWEENKYKKSSLVFDVNSSVKYRLQIACSMLRQILKGNSLLELGCGSGLFWECVNSLNFASYTGVDFSETAIKTFQNRVQNSTKNNKTHLYCEDCVQNVYPADIVMSLGLLDWLDIKQIRKLADSYKKAWYVHSFSEKCLSLSQAAHTIYSLMNYKYKVYSPKYRKADELLSIFGSNAKIYRHPKLSFGAFIYNLPKQVEFKC